MVLTKVSINGPDRTGAENEVIRRYEVHLTAYASQEGMPRQCLGMWQAENHLIKAVGRGIEKQFGDDVALGIALIMSHVFSAALAMDFARPSAETVKRGEERWVKEAAEFVSSRFRRGRFIKRPRKTVEEYQGILRELFDNWQ